MNDELKALLDKHIAAAFKHIEAINELIDEDKITVDVIGKWVDAQINEPTSEDDEALAYAISAFGDNLIDYGKEFNNNIQ